MSRRFTQHLRRNLFWFVLMTLVWLLCSGDAYGGPLSDRLATFPNWTDKPPTQPAKGDLVYPDWMAGTWELTSTLVDLSAPLAPELQTPGFESNQSLLNQPITCEVRFEPRMTSLTKSFLLKPRLAQEEIVADRAFNGLSLAQAYLGDQAVKTVKVDPKNPNRQVTFLRGDRQLESTVISRAVEVPSDERFVTTEIFQQVFRGTAQPYLNEVETTTAYQKRESDQSFSVTADQVTAIYLAPQDSDYFKARNQPIALYRYQLELSPIATPI
ncbi:hypothetical protein PN498_22780 [Oscillatoria sp. CS-180]|uniref:DUF6816 family protein n=1 Tax=Oscillatoria sp. CS-180 TaxID=3021720 RepID=UPI00232B49E9|nr:hypothetical protein [Oscillatoria sp. CS-180]MDB9528836.1 hypothetical protein [Oscillatoria sp. CS-180]